MPATWLAVGSELRLLKSSYMGVSWDGGTPKSSILIWFSIIHHSSWGIPTLGNIHIPHSKANQGATRYMPKSWPQRGGIHRQLPMDPWLRPLLGFPPKTMAKVNRLQRKHACMFFFWPRLVKLGYMFGCKFFFLFGECDARKHEVWQAGKQASNSEKCQTSTLSNQHGRMCTKMVILAHDILWMRHCTFVCAVCAELCVHPCT